MGFFDLNIPCTESNKQNPTTEKSNRLKLTVKAMELGYTGVAYNRTITGVMSELDRCSISLFPLSSVLKVSPSLSTAVNLHRSLLNVPASIPFRQYTRLTVVVDTPAQGSALNSGNPVLKTYDIVAVRPMKQESFDQACKNYEVDIIAIDFSENRFRLKQPLIKAAIERGVYFEITYSGLIMDAQLRRQIISNAKLLVDWTRGKNLIFSSAAPSVTELRGPYDVANLASLFGISMERANAALSKTCRSLLATALRKKKFYKEAIRVELMSSAKQSDIEGDGFADWLKWDPISSGEGDLQLDDMAKSFAASSKESKTVKAIDFDSIIDGLPSHGLHVKDVVSGIKGTSNPYNIGIHLSAATEIRRLLEVSELPVDSDMHDLPEKDQSGLMDKLEKGQLLSSEDSKISSANETLEVPESTNEGGSYSVISGEEAKILNDSNACFSCPEAVQKNLQPDVHKTICETKSVNVTSGNVQILVSDTEIATAGISTAFEDNLPDAKQSERSTNACSDAPLGLATVASTQAFIEPSACSKGDSSLSLSGLSLRQEFPESQNMRDTGDITASPSNSSMPSSSGLTLYEVISEGEHMNGVEDVPVAPADKAVTLRSDNEMQTMFDSSSCISKPLEEPMMDGQVKFEDRTGMSYLPESSSERVRGKQKSLRRSVLFPFKRFLQQSTFKKKARRFRTRSTIVDIRKRSG